MRDTSDPWASVSEATGVVLLDGATGTELEAQGVDVQQPLWSSVALLSSEGQALTEAVHRAYADAGAHMVIANSHNLAAQNVAAFRSKRPELIPDAVGVSDSVEALTRSLNTRAVQVARGAGVKVAGCLASPDVPYAKTASLTAAEVGDRLAVQYEALADARPDVIIFEMLTTRADLEGVAQLVVGADRRVPVAFGLVAGASGTMGGVSWSDAWSILRPARPSAVFVQCTPFSDAGAAFEGLAGALDFAGPRLGVYANDGGYDPVAQAWQDRRITPEAYAEGALRWREAGAEVIGGCCGTTPAHIAAIRNALASSPDR